jgi:hypothetical protein
VEAFDSGEFGRDETDIEGEAIEAKSKKYHIGKVWDSREPVDKEVVLCVEI